MLSKLFSKRQKAESLPEKPARDYRMVPEEDMRRYEFQEKLFQTIVSVEADAHNEEDPMAIAVRVMKACCDFYDADWCGILIADLQTQVFIPEIWYDSELLSRSRSSSRMRRRSGRAIRKSMRHISGWRPDRSWVFHLASIRWALWSSGI